MDVLKNEEIWFIPEDKLVQSLSLAGIESMGNCNENHANRVRARAQCVYVSVESLR